VQRFEKNVPRRAGVIVMMPWFSKKKYSKPFLFFLLPLLSKGGLGKETTCVAGALSLPYPAMQPLHYGNL